MNVSHILISSTLFLTALPALVIAIDPVSSGHILDTFKKEEYAILFENLPFDQSGSRDLIEHEYTMNGLE